MVILNEKCFFIKCKNKGAFNVGSEHKDIINKNKDNLVSSNRIFFVSFLTYIIHY